MDVNLIPLLPATQVLLTALVVMLLDLFIKEPEKGLLAWISLLGLALGAGETVLLWGSQESAFGDTLLLDNFALFFAQIFLGVAALTILSSIHYVRQTKIHEGEFYELILFATVGMILMAAANDLIIFFLGLETMSIAVYVLTGLWRASSQSSEAAMKYFLMGAFATGFLLYGIALIYSATGATNLNQISAYLVEQPTDWPLYLVAGALLLLVGFAFKVGAVPFHFWVPDVYEGAPTPVTGFMSVAVQAAAFAVITSLTDKEHPRESYTDFAGLGFKRPFLAMAISLFMLSLAGFPPLAGFARKFYIFRSAVLSGHVSLAIIGVLNSLLSVIYYLRVIVAMYMEEGGAEGKRFGQSPYLYIAVAFAVAGTVYLGIVPSKALEWSRISYFPLD